MQKHFEMNESQLVVQTYCMGLCFEKILVDSIPCISSADQTKFIVFLNKFDTKKFTKNTLFNLVNTAEKISPACQQVIFIAARYDSQPDEANQGKRVVSDNYESLKKTLEVIDCVRMKRSEID